MEFDVSIYTNHYFNDRGGTPSGSGGGRTTPSHMIRPIPHHVHHQQVPQLQVNYSPVNVPRFSQSPVSKCSEEGVAYKVVKFRGDPI